MEEIGGKRVKNPVLHGLKKRFLYLIACSTSQNQGMLWVGKDLKSQCSKGQGNAGSVQGLLQGCLHPFPSGNLQERKISAAPQGLGPQGHTGWVSFYQENLKAPKAQESAWSSWFCLILFPRNATRTIPRQILIQNFSLGAFSTQIQMCQNLSGLCISTGAHTGLEAAPNISEPQKCSKKKSCSFQKWPLLFCTVMICLWNIYNCHHPEPTQFSWSAQELRDWSQLFQQDLHSLQAAPEFWDWGVFTRNLSFGNPGFAVSKTLQGVKSIWVSNKILYFCFNAFCIMKTYSVTLVKNIVNL